MSAAAFREWALVIDPPVDRADAHATVLLGLTIVLRLALTAQAAGARAIVLGVDEADRPELRRSSAIDASRSTCSIVTASATRASEFRPTPSSMSPR